MNNSSEEENKNSRVSSIFILGIILGLLLAHTGIVSFVLGCGVGVFARDFISQLRLIEQKEKKPETISHRQAIIIKTFDNITRYIKHFYK